MSRFSSICPDDDSAGDGKNAMVQFTASAAGTYLIQIAAEAGQGEYLLQVDLDPKVVARHVFYNNSAFDNNDPSVPAFTPIPTPSA